MITFNASTVNYLSNICELYQSVSLPMPVGTSVDHQTVSGTRRGYNSIPEHAPAPGLPRFTWSGLAGLASTSHRAPGSAAATAARRRPDSIHGPTGPGGLASRSFRGASELAAGIRLSGEEARRFLGKISVWSPLRVQAHLVSRCAS